jgi:hypothetical protein
MSNPKSSKPAADGLPILLVRARKGGQFRRCGTTFYEGHWTALELAKLKSEDVARIEAEPMLQAQRVNHATASELTRDNPKPSIAREKAMAQRVVELEAKVEELSRQLVEVLQRNETRPPLGPS